MDRKTKLILICVGIVACMAFIVYAALSGKGGLVYYYTVSEFKSLDKSREGGFRINGRVSSGSIVRAASGVDVRFSMTDGQQTLPVEYHGVVPDTFVDDAEVVVEGGLRSDGTFQATNLLAKCPSKYEAKTKAGEKNPHKDSRAQGI
jgi:cytochrome c-type biogenesis protein CcmE